MRRCPVPSRRGHTLVEIAVALAIVGILAAIGLSSGREQISRYRLMNVARALHADLVAAKANAIASQREMRVCFTAWDAALDPAAPQAGTWTLEAGNRATASTRWDPLPIDVEGVVDDSDGLHDLAPEGNDATPGVSLATVPTLEGPGSANAGCLVYSPRGWVENPGTDFADGYIALRVVNKVALARGEEEEVTIRVSRGGLARLEAGASSTLPVGGVGTATATTP